MSPKRFKLVEEIAELLFPHPTEAQTRILLAVAILLGFDGLLRSFYGGSLDMPDDDEPAGDEPEGHMIDVVPELAPSWDRYARWATLCAVGRCAYDDLDGDLAEPPWRRRTDLEDRCPGYTGFLAVEEERQVLRVRGCDRKRAWAKRRAAFVREERRKARDREKAARS